MAIIVLQFNLKGLYLETASENLAEQRKVILKNERGYYHET